MADILSLSGDGLVSHCIPLKQADLTNARTESDAIFDDTWQWLWRVMETTETQLRYKINDYLKGRVQDLWINCLILMIRLLDIVIVLF